MLDRIGAAGARHVIGKFKPAALRQIHTAGNTVTAIAPSPEDIVVSKLARLEEKDRDYIKAFHAARPLDPDVIEKRIRASGMAGAIEVRALAFLRGLVCDREHDGGGDGAGGDLGGGPR